MKPEDLRVLAQRAESVEGRQTTRLDEVHARVGRARARRQAGTIGGAVFAVVLVLSAATTLVNLTGDDTPPANPPRPAVTPSNPPEKPEDDRPTVRPLVWAEGTTVHVGKRTIDAAGPVTYIDASDDGVVFVTQSAAREPGPDLVLRRCGAGPDRPPHRVWDRVGVRRRGSNPGSLLVWAEAVGSGRFRDQGDYVVYDTDQRRVLARFGGPEARIEAVYPESVYWVPNEKKWCVDFDRHGGFCRRYSGIMRYDAASGRQTRASWAAYLRGRLTQPRTLVQGDSARSRQVEEKSPYFWRVGRRLVPIGGRPSSVVGYDYRDDSTTLSVANTGEPVRLRVPADFRASDVFQLVQWLDDDRVVVFAYCCGAEHRGYLGYPFGGSETADSGDLFTCRLSSGECSLAVKRSEDGYEVPLAD